MKSHLVTAPKGFKLLSIMCHVHREALILGKLKNIGKNLTKYGKRSFLKYLHTRGPS